MDSDIVPKVPEITLKIESDLDEALLPMGFTTRTMRDVLPHAMYRKQEEIRGYDLSLMAVNTTDELVHTGHLLVVVALVKEKVHIRIFHPAWIRIDKPEEELLRGAALTDLKALLNSDPFPDPSTFSAEKRQQIIDNAVSCSGLDLIVRRICRGICVESTVERGGYDNVTLMPIEYLRDPLITLSVTFYNSEVPVVFPVYLCKNCRHSELIRPVSRVLATIELFGRLVENDDLFELVSQISVERAGSKQQVRVLTAILE